MPNQPTLISSAESDLSQSPSKVPDSEPCDFPKYAQPNPESCANSGLIFRTQETSQICQTNTLMSLRLECLARLQAVAAFNSGSMTTAGCGGELSTPFAELDPNSQSLRTSQISFALMEEPHSTESYQDWPREGLMLGGRAFQLQSLVRPLSASDCLLLPSPCNNDGRGYYVASLESSKYRQRTGQQMHWIHAVLLCKQLKKAWANPAFSAAMMGLPPNLHLPLMGIRSVRKSHKSSPKPSTKS